MSMTETTSSVTIWFGRHGLSPTASNPDLWPLWPYDFETGMWVASEVGNFPSEFGHARPLGSRIIRYVRDGGADRQTDRQKQCEKRFSVFYAPFPTVSEWHRQQTMCHPQHSTAEETTLCYLRAEQLKLLWSKCSHLQMKIWLFTQKNKNTESTRLFWPKNKKVAIFRTKNENEIRLGSSSWQ